MGNKANEYLTRKVKGSENKGVLADEFASSTAANWSMPSGAMDTFDVNTTTAGSLTVNSVAADTFAGQTESEPRAVLLTGEDIGTCHLWAGLTFPSGSTSSDEAGVVFGYKTPNDYWISVRTATSTAHNVYHVVNGSKTLAGESHPASTAVRLTLNRQSAGTYTFPSGDGLPSGKVGLYTNKAGVTFEYFRLYDSARYVETAGRWINYSGGIDHTANCIDSSNDRLKLSRNDAGAAPILLKGVRVDRFRATFSVRRNSSTSDDVRFVFNATNYDDCDSLLIKHGSTAQAPKGYEVEEGQAESSVTATRTDANTPTAAQTDVLWVRVINDGTTVTVKETVNATAPTETDWSGVSDCFSTTAFDNAGGMIGFAGDDDTTWVDDLTLEADRDANGSYEVVEHVEAFTVDGGGYAEETLAYDRNGNLTYDGVHGYAYDAWDRVAETSKVYRDYFGAVNIASGVLLAKYDGLGRLVLEELTNSADKSMSSHYYYLSRRQAGEVHNGQGEVVKQNVWGALYIDELVETSLNEDPSDPAEQIAERRYWSVHTTNYSLLGLVEESGAVVARYEYDMDASIKAYIGSSGSDRALSPVLFDSQVVALAGSVQPYPLNDIGHQGLRHLWFCPIENRARWIHPGLGRFHQRDPSGYTDGRNLYEYLRSNPAVYRDPSGLGCRVVFECYLGSAVLVTGNTRQCTYTCYEKLSERSGSLSGNVSCDDIPKPFSGVPSYSETLRGSFLHGLTMGLCGSPPGPCRSKIDRIVKIYLNHGDAPDRDCSRTACVTACSVAKDSKLVPDPTGALYMACVSTCNAWCEKP